MEEPKAISVQQPEKEASAPSIFFLPRWAQSLTTCPAYWSPSRDEWMQEFLRTPGNDLLAGCVANLVARVAATNWYIEGPLEMAQLYHHILLYWSDFYAGWETLVEKWVHSFLTRDFGGVVEFLKAPGHTREGPSLGIAHLDESRCIPTNDPEYPILYRDQSGNLRKMHRTQIGRIVDSPNPLRAYKGVGYCSVSRALVVAHVLMDLLKYKRERLSDLPPAGILFVNNMTEPQWQDLEEKYRLNEENKGNSIWRNVMVALGVDPQFPVSAELFEFSQLPENFDEKEFMNVIMYSFAMAFREDPREFWPVSAGPLGTAREAELMHKKAKVKGLGIILQSITRQLNRPDFLPPELTFHFDFRDDEEDRMRAEINDIKARWITRLTRPQGGGGMLGAEGSAEPLISRDEARALLVREGVVSADLLGVTLDYERIYGIRSFGPRARVYSDGRIEGVEP